MVVQVNHKQLDPPVDLQDEITQLYVHKTTRKILILVGLLVMLGISVIVAASLGSVSTSIADVFQVISGKLIPGNDFASTNAFITTVIWDMRFPRILLAVLAGIALAGSGTVMQSVLRNPLVSPYTLGLSSAAAFGAALAIVLGVGLGIFGKFIIVIHAFIFGSLTILFIYAIASIKGTGKETFILGGVAIGYLFSAGVSILKYVSNLEELREIVVWLMGGLWGASWNSVALLFPIVMICLAILLKSAWNLNAMGAGEAVATNLGVNVKRLRLTSLLISTLAASSVIAFTGIIGFIGLIAPHMCRMLIGGDNRFLIPCSALMGAIILLISDTLGRTILAPTEIPVGIITSIIGVPFFIYLLIKQKRKWWG